MNYKWYKGYGVPVNATYKSFLDKFNSLDDFAEYYVSKVGWDQLLRPKKITIAKAVSEMVELDGL